MKKCFTRTFNIVSVFSLVMWYRTLGSIPSQNALKLDHLSLSSINLLSLFLLSSIKRRHICSTFDRYTLISSLRYWPSRQRNGRSAFSLIT
uniref:Uncharacterized protein n=1 Tax=Arundo donax TaxID=35708 RepID=A0A0A9DWW1_ARUDO